MVLQLHEAYCRSAHFRSLQPDHPRIPDTRAPVVTFKDRAISDFTVVAIRRCVAEQKAF